MWQSAWKLTSAFTETHIANRELHYALGLFEGNIVLEYISGCGVFSAAKEIIKGDKN